MWTQGVNFQLCFDASLMEMMQLVARQDGYFLPKNIVPRTNLANIITFQYAINIAYSLKSLDESRIQA